MRRSSPNASEVDARTPQTGTDSSRRASFDLPLERQPLLRAKPQDCAAPVEVLGVTVNRYTVSQAVAKVDHFIRQGGTYAVYFVNAHTLNLAAEDREYRDILNAGDLVLNDGIGLDIALSVNATRFPANLCGTDFVPELCQYAVEGGHSVFFLGGRLGIAERAAEALKQYFPELNICGTHHGYFDKESCKDVLECIYRTEPDILLVGFGNPLQEEWIHEHKDRLPECVAIGVGALFDYLAGKESRAPRVVRTLRCEWIYRLLMAPGSKWRRYVLGNPLFLYRVYKARLLDLLPIHRQKSGTK